MSAAAFDIEHRAVVPGVREQPVLGRYEVVASSAAEARAALLRAYSGYDGTCEVLIVRRATRGSRAAAQ